MSQRLVLGLALVAMLWAIPASAGEVSKTFTFELDKWYELNSTDGPVTLHRLRLEKLTGGFVKLARSDEYSTTLELQIEYSNESTQDWKAQVVVEWLDATGAVIDGHRGKPDLDEGDRHELRKSSITTLRYGLERAVKLRVEISYYAD